MDDDTFTALAGPPADRAAILREAANALACLGPEDSLVSGPKAWNEAIETLRRMADEAQQTEAEFTEARAAFMQIGRTSSLEGLRAELLIEGWPSLVGRYVGASMGRMHDVPGHEHLLAVDPRLIFEYADEKPEAAEGAQR